MDENITVIKTTMAVLAKDQVACVTCVLYHSVLCLSLYCACVMQHEHLMLQY